MLAQAPEPDSMASSVPGLGVILTEKMVLAKARAERYGQTMHVTGTSVLYLSQALNGCSMPLQAQ